MRLYTRYLSPFGRRVGVWLGLQGIPFEQVSIAPVPDFEALLQKNAVGRVPVLELESGQRLVDSTMICDHLECVAEPAQRLIPTDPAPRLVTMQRIARAHGVTEKAVAYFYETGRRPTELQWEDWAGRLLRQIQSGLAELEAMTPESGYFGGDKPDGADVVSAILYDFLCVTQKDALDGQPMREIAPKLAALSARANALAPFSSTTPQPG